MSKSFTELMQDPTDWFELAAELTRQHAQELAGQGADGTVHKEAADPSAPSPVNVIQLDRRRRP